MSYTSVILRCPDALYTWFEERLTGGATVEQIMVTALYDWQRMSQMNDRIALLPQSLKGNTGALLPNGERAHDEKRPDERPILA